MDFGVVGVAGGKVVNVTAACFTVNPSSKLCADATVVQQVTDRCVGRASCELSSRADLWQSAASSPVGSDPRVLHVVRTLHGGCDWTEDCREYQPLDGLGSGVGGWVGGGHRRRTVQSPQQQSSP